MSQHRRFFILVAAALFSLLLLLVLTLPYPNGSVPAGLPDDGAGVLDELNPSNPTEDFGGEAAAGVPRPDPPEERLARIAGQRAKEAQPAPSSPEANPSGPGGTGSARSFTVLGYWARWGDDPRPAASLKENRQRIDVVAPYWYTLEGDGSLSSREEGQVAWVDEAHAAGQQVVILVNKVRGDERVLLDPKIRRTAVDNLARLAKDEKVDGIHIDFEGLPAGVRDGLTEFTRLLAEKLHPVGKSVSLAVGPKWHPSPDRNPAAAAYDYAALGELADFIVIMTYDQHTRGSQAGPVAAYPWVRKIVEYSSTLIPPEKILIGLAGYGYDWSKAGGATVEAHAAPDLAARYGAEIQWDEKARVPHFTYWREGQAHEVWYQNSYSAEAKLGLIREFELGGLALWRLGQEDPRLWEVLESLSAGQ